MTDPVSLMSSVTEFMNNDRFKYTGEPENTQNYIAIVNNLKIDEPSVGKLEEDSGGGFSAFTRKLIQTEANPSTDNFE